MGAGVVVKVVGEALIEVLVEVVVDGVTVVETASALL